MKAIEQAATLNFEELVNEFEREHLVWALTRTVTKSSAAKLLGMSYRSFRHYFVKHNLKNLGVDEVRIISTKNLARNMVSRAVKQGKVVRPSTCTRCGARGKTHGHHLDYTQPLMVVWLCNPCHSLEHSLMRLKERESKNFKL